MVGDTIEGMDAEIEQKANETEFLENKIGLPDPKVFAEMHKLGLNKTSSKRKGHRIMDRITNSLNNHNYIENNNRNKLFK